MPLAYLLDEHLRRRLWRAIRAHNARGTDTLDVVRDGDPSDLPLGSNDAELLVWAEHENRILISRDQRTLAGHLADHLQSGRHSPGIFTIRRHSTPALVIAFLAYAAYESEPFEWQDRIEYVG